MICIVLGLVKFSECVSITASVFHILPSGNMYSVWYEFYWMKRLMCGKRWTRMPCRCRFRVCVCVFVACADDKTQWIIFTAVHFFPPLRSNFFIRYKWYRIWFSDGYAKLEKHFKREIQQQFSSVYILKVALVSRRQKSNYTSECMHSCTHR